MNSMKDKCIYIVSSGILKETVQQNDELTYQIRTNSVLFKFRI